MQTEIDTTKLKLAEVTGKYAAQQEECSAHGYKYYMVKQKYANERKARIADQEIFKHEIAVRDATITALQNSLSQSRSVQPSFNQSTIMPNLHFPMAMPNFPQIQAIPQNQYQTPNIPTVPRITFSKLNEVDSDESVELPSSFKKH